MASFASAWPMEVRRERFRGCDMKLIAVRAQQKKTKPKPYRMAPDYDWYPYPVEPLYSLKRVGEKVAGDKLIADLANRRLTCLRKNDEGVYRKAWSRGLTPAEVKANTPKGGY